MYPYQIRLPLAPYRFVWKDGPAVSATKRSTDLYVEEDYLHGDGTHTIIREYRADGSYHILSDRGEIELVDNALDPYAPDPVSLVRLPLVAALCIQSAVYLVRVGIGIRGDPAARAPCSVAAVGL